jgi:hypothetical protein
VIALIKMFQSGDSTMGIVCIVLTLCTGLGPLIALILSWVKSAQYGLSRGFLMLWTAMVIGSFVLVGAGYGMMISAILNDPAIRQQMEQLEQMEHGDPMPD